MSNGLVFPNSVHWLAAASKIDLYITHEQKVILHVHHGGPSIHRHQQRAQHWQQRRLSAMTSGQSLSQTSSNHSQPASSSTSLSTESSDPRPTSLPLPAPTQLPPASVPSSGKNKVVSFSPKDGTFSVDYHHYDDYTPTLEAYSQEIRIHGVIGVLDLGFVKFLLYIKKRRVIAKLGEKKIYKLVEAGHIVIYRRSYLTLSEEQLEREGLDGCLHILNSGLFYFSYEWDLTSHCQRLFTHLQTSELTEQTPQTEQSHFIFEYANEKYWWNEWLLHGFLDRAEECSDLIVPLICGYIGYLPTSLPSALSPADQEMEAIDVDLDLLLISRIHKGRVGTRYNRRGLDCEGYAANHVETELLALASNKMVSFVQVRGSLPWLWKQTIDLSYKPPITVEPSTSTYARAAFEQHMKQLRNDYGDNLIIYNLLNANGFEKPLTHVYTQVVQEQHPPLEYHHFDLNQSPCGASSETIQSLLTTAEASVDSVSFCIVRSKPMPIRRPSLQTNEASTLLQQRQQGVIRTNCLDCLDRTNMIQYLVATVALFKMLNALGVVVPCTIDKSDLCVGQLRTILGDRALSSYRQLWTQNGDAIAFQYTGTGALNSQFISHGKCHHERSKETLIRKVMDGCHALGRYYLNNFVDAYRQDDLDLLLGNHRGPVTQLLSPSEYAACMQQLQRRQSFAVSRSPVNQATFLHYLLLLHRHWGPMELRSVWHYIWALLWLMLFMSWYIIFIKFGVRRLFLRAKLARRTIHYGEFGDRVVWRQPKSGTPSWEGDANPLEFNDV